MSAFLRSRFVSHFHSFLFSSPVLKMLVKPMRKGVNTTVIIDCCHSGSALDLPYESEAVNGKVRMNRQNGFNMDIVTEAVRPLSKTEKREKYMQEKAARKAARAAERKKLKEEAAKREPTVTYAMPSASDIEAAQQKLLEQATANARSSGNGNTVVSVGPVQMVMGGPGGQVVYPTVTKHVVTTAPKCRSAAETSTVFPPKATTYKVLVHPGGGGAIPVTGSTRVGTGSTSLKKKATSITKKPKSKGVGSLIARFESSS